MEVFAQQKYTALLYLPHLSEKIDGIITKRTIREGSWNVNRELWALWISNKELGMKKECDDEIIE